LPPSFREKVGKIPPPKKSLRENRYFFPQKSPRLVGYLLPFQVQIKKNLFKKGVKTGHDHGLIRGRQWAPSAAGCFFFFFFYSVRLTLASTSHTIKKKFFAAGFGRPSWLNPCRLAGPEPPPCFIFFLLRQPSPAFRRSEIQKNF